MQILTIRKGFEAFEYKFETFEKIRSIRMQIRTIQKAFAAFESKFEVLKRHLKHSNANTNHSKGIWSIRMQILTVQKGSKAF